MFTCYVNNTKGVGIQLNYMDITVILNYILNNLPILDESSIVLNGCNISVKELIFIHSVCGDLNRYADTKEGITYDY